MSLVYRKLRVEVHNKRSIEKITNVIGTIRGEVEPGEHITLWKRQYQ